MFGMVNFAKSAGAKFRGLFKGKEAKKHIEDKYGLDTTGVDIHVDDNGEVTLSGKAVSQEMKEKIILAVGNVEGVGGVKDEAETDDNGVPSKFHEVVRGDTLWAISKKYYGKGGRYMEIFEANKPMLSDPDKIYVGQVLRIPMDADNSASA